MADTLDDFWQDRRVKIGYETAEELARKFNDANWRGHPEEQADALDDSLETLQWIGSVKVNLSTNRIFDGHLRVTRALVKNPQMPIPVDYYDLTPDEEMLALQIHDAITEQAQPIPEKLAALLERTRAMTADKPGLGAMLDALRQRAGVNGKGEAKDAPPQIDKAAQLAEIWGTRVGQVWELGVHRLAVGDCTKKEVVEAVAFGERINFVYVDPPYSVAYADKNASLNAVAFGNRIQTPIENDHLGVEETAKTIWKPAFTNLFDLALPGCAYYCSAPQGGDQMMMMMMMLCESGWLVKHEIIWVKNNHVLGRADYQYKHEPIIYGWKPGAGHYFIDSRSEFSVWEIDKPHNSDYHPTTKPLELVERAINNSSRPGDICADFFVGSGTTILAGENLGRKVRAIELDPGYAAVTLDRFFIATGIEPKLT